MAQVHIIGGGLAGIVCAQELLAAGVDFELYEASDVLGGRLRTTDVEGFLLDHGFQVVFDAYPTFSALTHGLKLHRFENGAKIFDGSRLRVFSQTDILGSALSPVMTLSDKLRLLWLRRKALRGTIQPDRSIQAELAAFSPLAMKRFFRPFFGGIFLESSLQSSANQFLWIFGYLSRGSACVPDKGIAAIPRWLSKGLPPEKVHLKSKIVSLEFTHGTVTGFRLQNGSVIQSDCVVLATDPLTLSSLLALPAPCDWKKCTTLHFASVEPITPGKLLVLNGTGEGIVNEVAPMSNVCPELAPAGQHLFSATVLGESTLSDVELTRMVVQELSVWFPRAPAEQWRLLRIDRIGFAQMQQEPDFQPMALRQKGAWICGEATVNSSIEGAILAGRAAARGLLEQK